MVQVFEGPQNVASFSDMAKMSEEHIRSLRHANKPVYILVDIGQMERLTATVRQQAVRAMSDVDFDKIAVIGTTVVTKTLVNLIALSAGKSRFVRVFDNEGQARQWMEKCNAPQG